MVVIVGESVAGPMVVARRGDRGAVVESCFMREPGRVRRFGAGCRGGDPVGMQLGAVEAALASTAQATHGLNPAAL
jgi:hypothetical protein